MPQDPGKTSQQPDEQELDQTYRQYTQAPQPGGRTERGPAVHSGGETEAQGMVPPYEGRQKQAGDLDQQRPSQAGDENIMGSAGIRQTDEPPTDSPSPLGSDQGSADLNKNTGTDASAEELKERIDQASAHTEEGAGSGDPDPVTQENVHATTNEAQGRPRSGEQGG